MFKTIQIDLGSLDQIKELQVKNKELLKAIYLVVQGLVSFQFYLESQFRFQPLHHRSPSSSSPSWLKGKESLS